MSKIHLHGAIWAFALMALPGPASAGPSFDCHTNRGLTEQVICGNDDLGELDSEMAGLYFRVTNDSTGRYYRRLKLDQRQWLAERDGCGANVRCLRSTYRARIDELQQVLHAAD